MDAELTEHDSRYIVGEVTVDAARNLLRCKGETAHVEPKLIEVLSLLASDPGRVYSREEVLDAVWRGVSVGDESLTRVISQLRKALSVAPGGRDYIETVPKRGYRLAVERRRAGAGAATSPATQPAPQGAPPRENARRFLILAVGAVALSGAAAALSVMQAKPPEAVIRDAVEIAAWRAVDDSDRAKALAGAMPVRLAHEFQARGVAALAAVDAASEAPGAKAEFLLSGVASATGADLILQDRHGAVLWTHHADRPIAPNGAKAASSMTDHLANRLAARAAAMIDCGLFRRRLIPHEISAELHAAWFLICALSVDQRRAEALEQAQKIAAMAPDDAASYSSLAFARIRLADTLSPGEAADGLIADARRATERALEIDPHFTEALLAKATALPAGDYAAREVLTVAAGKSDPAYPWQRSLYVRFLREVGRLDEATLFVERVRALKRTPDVEADYAWLLAQQGEEEKALGLLDQIAARWPHDAIGPWRRFNIEAFYGNVDEAARLAASLGDNPHFAASGGAACWTPFLEARRTGDAAHLAAMKENCTSDQPIARAYGAMGKIDGALDALRAVLAAPPDRGETIPLFYREFRGVRRDPRFAEILRKTSLPDYWRKTGRLADFCRKPGLAFDCAAIAER